MTYSPYFLDREVQFGDPQGATGRDHPEEVSRSGIAGLMTYPGHVQHPLAEQVYRYTTHRPQNQSSPVCLARDPRPFFLPASVVLLPSYSPGISHCPSSSIHSCHCPIASTPPAVSPRPTPASLRSAPPSLTLGLSPTSLPTARPRSPQLSPERPSGISTKSTWYQRTRGDSA